MFHSQTYPGIKKLLYYNTVINIINKNKTTEENWRYQLHAVIKPAVGDVNTLNLNPMVSFLSILYILLTFCTITYRLSNLGKETLTVQHEFFLYTVGQCITLT